MRCCKQRMIALPSASSEEYHELHACRKPSGSTSLLIRPFHLSRSDVAVAIFTARVLCNYFFLPVSFPLAGSEIADNGIQLKAAIQQLSTREEPP